MSSALTRKLWGATVLSLLAVGQPDAADADSVTLRADYWCPYNCDPGDKYPGYMIEIAKRAIERAGLSIDYQLMPWDRAMSEVRNGTIDAAVGASELEGDGLVLTDPIGFDADCFYVAADNPWRFDGVASLKEVLLGSVSGYSHDEGPIDDYIASNDQSSGRVTTTKGDEASSRNIRLLLLGRVDAILDSQAVVAMELSSQGQASKVVEAGCLKRLPLYIAFSPRNAAAQKLAGAINEEVDELRKSGRLAEILAHYGLVDWLN